MEVQMKVRVAVWMMVVTIALLVSPGAGQGGARGGNFATAQRAGGNEEGAGRD